MNRVHRERQAQETQRLPAPAPAALPAKTAAPKPEKAPAQAAPPRPARRARK